MIENPERNLSPEHEFDEAVVEVNLRRISSEMLDFLKTESMGGNAGEIEIEGKKQPLLGVNGYAERQTGVIIGFSNSPLERFRPELKDFIRNYTHLNWRVTLDINKIIGAIYEGGELSPKAKASLEESIRRWNEEREKLLKNPESGKNKK